MHIQELQQWIKEDWEQRSKSLPSRELQMLYLIEEIGEVAEAIRKTDGNKERTSTAVDVGSEIADVLIALLTLANTYNVDVTREIALFQERLAARQQAGY